MRPKCRPLLLTISALVMCAGNVAAQRSLVDGTKELATQIAAGTTKEQKRRIAVVPFRQLGGRVTVLGAFLAEELVSVLFSMGTMDIVERSLLDKVFGELKLDASGVIDPQTAKQMGRVVGVEAIVTGTITELDSHIAVNCRMIDTQTGRVFGAAQTRIVKDTEVRRILEAPLPDTQLSGTTQDTPSRARSSQSQEAQRVTTGGVVFELGGCRASGTSVTCRLSASSSGEDAHLWISQNSKAFDASANEHSVKSMTLGNKRGSSWMGPSATLVQGVTTPASLTFEGVPADVTALALLEMKAIIRHGGVRGRADNITVEFREIALQR